MNFQGNLTKFSACRSHFYKNGQLINLKAYLRTKNFSPTEVLKITPLTNMRNCTRTDQTPTENPESQHIKKMLFHQIDSRISTSVIPDFHDRQPKQTVFPALNVTSHLFSHSTVSLRSNSDSEGSHLINLLTQFRYFVDKI